MRRETLLAFSVIFLAGCATVAPVSTPPYFPPNPSAVLLKHQGEIEASGSVSTGGETFLAAYALTPHLGVLASGSMALHKTGDPNGNQYSGELGAGFFDTMAQSHVYDELYAGAGWGVGSAPARMQLANLFADLWPYSEISGTENRNFWNGWVQGDAGYSNGNFSLMAIIHIEYVALYHDVTSGTVTTHYGTRDYATSDTTYFGQGNFFWLLTPALEARYGLEHIQLIGTMFLPSSGAASHGNPRALGSLGICYEF